MDYHAIVLDISLTSPIIDQFRVLGKKRDGAWTIYKLEIPEPALKWAIALLQRHLKPNGFYAHLYRGQELVVVFPEKVFMLTVEPDSWTEAIAYGQAIGVPLQQLDFFPCRIQDELF